jgi:hypothetical protein
LNKSDHLHHRLAKVKFTKLRDQIAGVNEDLKRHIFMTSVHDGMGLWCVQCCTARMEGLMCVPGSLFVALILLSDSLCLPVERSMKSLSQYLLGLAVDGDWMFPADVVCGMIAGSSVHVCAGVFSCSLV